MAKTRRRSRKKKTSGSRPTYRMFVDYENSPDCLDLLQEYDHEEVWIFVGRQQKKIPLDLVQSMQALGSAVHWISPGAVGKNALDFILSMHVGIHHAEAPPSVHFAILSADKGFDPLIAELEKSGRTVVRVEPKRAKTRRKKKAKTTRASTTSAASGTTSAASGTTRRKKKSKAKKTKTTTRKTETVASLTALVAERLDRMAESRLPTRRKGLVKHIESQLPADQKDKAEAVVNGLRRRKVLKITRAGTVEYA